MNDDMLTIAKAAEFLQVSPTDVKALVDSGQLEGGNDPQSGEVTVSKSSAQRYQAGKEAPQRNDEGSGSSLSDMESYDVGILEAEVAEEKRHGLADPREHTSS